MGTLVRTMRPLEESFGTLLLVPIDPLASRFSADAEAGAQVGHVNRFTVWSAMKRIFWSMGDVSFQGMGHLLGVPCSMSKCYPSTRNDLSPIRPDRTIMASNNRLKLTARLFLAERPQLNRSVMRTLFILIDMCHVTHYT
jgi:hypothetical protein